MIQVPDSLNIASITQYLSSLPSDAISGDVFAICILLILIYIAIFVIQKLTAVLVHVLKKIFLFIIVSLAFYQFLKVFIGRVALEGFTADTIIFGLVGFIIGFAAFLIALYVAFHSIKKLEKPADMIKTETGEGAEIQPAAPAVPEPPVELREPETPAVPAGEKTTLKDELSLSALKSDKRIGAVIAYIVIAQFGVFSSKTIAAPTPETGLFFFVAFILACMVFIRLTYHDYWRGIRHLAAGVIIGGILSIVLGFFWGAIPLDQLLSISYFSTDSLVALITGLALSLFMGSIN